MSLFETVLNLLRARRPAIEERVELASQAMEVAKEQALLRKFMPAVRERRKLLATPEMNFDLGKARTNTVIDNQGGEVIFVVTCTGTARFRFDGVEKSLYLIRPGVMVMPFEKLYLTNTAQAGKTLSMIIGQDPGVNFVVDPTTEEMKNAVTELKAMVAETQASVALLGNLPQRSTTPLLASITMTLADTEYSYTFPDNIKKFSLEIGAGGANFRVAWVTGKVAAPTQPYIEIWANDKFARENINLIGKTIYFACPNAAQLMVIESYT